MSEETLKSEFLALPCCSKLSADVVELTLVSKGSFTREAFNFQPIATFREAHKRMERDLARKFAEKYDLINKIIWRNLHDFGS